MALGQVPVMRFDRSYRQYGDLVFLLRDAVQIRGGQIPIIYLLAIVCYFLLPPDNQTVNGLPVRVS